MKKELWTEYQLNYLRENFSQGNLKEISKLLSIDVQSLRNKAKELKLKKEKVFAYWTSTELAWLKNNYQIKTNDELSLHLKRSPSLIYKMLKRLNLKRSIQPEIIEFPINAKKDNSSIIENPNWKYSFEEIKKVASQYKTRSEFSYHNKALLEYAREKGWIDKVCSHMWRKAFSTPQLLLATMLEELFKIEIKYNDRKEIKPLELDIFIPSHKVAFEYNGTYWHKDNPRDTKKIIACESSNIKLFVIDQISDDYVVQLKEELVKLLDKLNSIFGSNVSPQDVALLNELFLYKQVSAKIVDIPYVKKIITQYSTLKEFIQKENTLYHHLKHKKMLDLLAPLQREYPKTISIRWTKELIDKEISKYVKYVDFLKESKKCYKHLLRAKQLHLIAHLERSECNFKGTVSNA